MENKTQIPNESKTVSKLISDMAFRGATNEELNAAVKYSVDILDSAKRNGIEELQCKYSSNPIEKAYRLIDEACNDPEKAENLDLEEIRGYLGEALS